MAVDGGRETEGVGAAVRLERSNDGQVAWLRFVSEHPLNVITMGTLEQFDAALGDLTSDEPPRVLVITGRPDMFTGGAELGAFLEMETAPYRAYVELEYSVFDRVERLPFVTIAAVAGQCIGNGTELALACDLRIGTQGVKIGLPETRIGFMAPAQRLTSYVGIGRAKELLYSGRLLAAQEAEELGLLNEVVPDDELEAAATRLAGKYARMAPVALRLTKQNVAAAYQRPAENFSRELVGAVESFTSEDFREGATAVLDRRPPRFEGR